ncbi:uncharacterized protein B0I36DRAFT_105050 [Microdochium trichocladiopsis]|uniref:Uncharacterized protein n=1 Tax=Microdochium trichocladiopsis TaxID=1682393 RepID=A0A9P8Y9L3_9PEZI|nr:uncharacterized protein B0I36DRAFT_105050 [Microdochium trichocladiopsis]KAH7033106.1 hypothetical protein B0I36DRAFT_105050 [Microdochium trichocladiopsis]
MPPDYEPASALKRSRRSPQHPSSGSITEKSAVSCAQTWIVAADNLHPGARSAVMTTYQKPGRSYSSESGIGTATVHPILFWLATTADLTGRKWARDAMAVLEELLPCWMHMSSLATFAVKIDRGSDCPNSIFRIFSQFRPPEKRESRLPNRGIHSSLRPVWS